MLAEQRRASARKLLNSDAARASFSEGLKKVPQSEPIKDLPAGLHSLASDIESAS